MAYKDWSTWAPKSRGNIYQSKKKKKYKPLTSLPQFSFIVTGRTKVTEEKIDCQKYDIDGSLLEE